MKRSLTTAVLGTVLFFAATAYSVPSAEVPESVNTAVWRAVQRRDFDRAVALVRPSADRGNKDAEFSVAILFTLHAYILHGDHPDSPDIPKLEGTAINWLKKAASHGNHEAAELYGEVRKRGSQGLYFISIDHLLQANEDESSYRKIMPKAKR